MFNLGFTEMIILGVIILVFVGPNELPELARMVGRFLNEFRRSTDALKDEWHRSTEDINPKKFMGELKSDIENSIGGSTDVVSAPEPAAVKPPPPPPPVGNPEIVSTAEPSVESTAAAEEKPAGPSYPPDGKYDR